MAEGLEILDYTGAGYAPVMNYGDWRVAVINYSEEFKENNFEKIERHNLTDEVFILFEGEGTMVIGEKLEKIPMEKGKIYNVKKGVWHANFMTPGSKIIIVENHDTGAENTDYLYVGKNEKTS